MSYRVVEELTGEHPHRAGAPFAGIVNLSNGDELDLVFQSDVIAGNLIDIDGPRLPHKVHGRRVRHRRHDILYHCAFAPEILHKIGKNARPEKAV